MTATRILVVGASLAGVRAAEAIRRAGFDGTVTLVGDETYFPPADRPPLSKRFLLSESADQVDELRLAPDLDLTLRLGIRAVGLDTSARQVLLDGGERLGYDGLVIATGSVVRRLPGTIDRSNVYVLRNLDDARALHGALVAGARVSVIGAGVLGCEIAATCRQRGLDVSLIDVFSHPMLRVLGPKASQLLTDLHLGHGVRMLLGRHVLGLRGTPQVDAVVLDDDELIEADVVVVAIGASPQTTWLEGSGVEIGDGVVCDENCFAVGSTDIVAAGDVARWWHPLLGEHVRVEHWTNAVSQGQAAGRNLVAALSGSGGVTPYDVLPYFWSDQYDWKLQSVGILGDEISFEETDQDNSRYVVSYRTDGRLVGALCVNWPSRIPAWRRKVTEALGAATEIAS